MAIDREDRAAFGKATTSAVKNIGAAQAEGRTMGPSAPAKKTTTRRTPRYDATGKLTGYLVETLDENGNVISSVIEGVDTPLTDTSSSQSAYDSLYNEFKKYGLESLVEPLKGLIQQGASGAAMTLALQNTEAYKKRFSANQERINKGLSALTPAEYIALEDQYQNIMRNYGLPPEYYAKDATGKQAGFDQLIGYNVSPVELESRVLEGRKALDDNPETLRALKSFYPELTDGDVLSYVINPTKALIDIKKKVAAAQIGGAALGQGLATSVSRAEELGAAGITKTQAQQGYQAIGEFLPTASKLSEIYKEGPYTQTTAEQELFNLGEYKDEKGNLVRMSAVEAAKKRKRLAQMEQASFGGSAGTAGSALSRDRALSAQSYREPGAGAY